MEKVAYGPLCLTPDQFWSLTYHELVALYEGYAHRVERDRYTDAWKLSILMQPHAPKGKQFKPEDFLGRETADQMRKKQANAEWERIQERNRRREEGLPPLSRGE